MERPCWENDWIEVCSGGGKRKEVHCVQHYHIRSVVRLCVSCSGASEDIGMEFGGGDGGEVGGVRVWNRDALSWVQQVVDEGIEAFRRELVIGKGPEEFGNENVDFVPFGLLLLI